LTDTDKQNTTGKYTKSKQHKIQQKKTTCPWFSRVLRHSIRKPT